MSEQRVSANRDLFYIGRENDPRLGSYVVPWKESDRKDVAVIWGCPDDTGIKINHGRAGAALGPDSVRKHLYRMTPPMDFDWKIILQDAGNLIPKKDILQTQRACQEEACRLSKSLGAILVAIGGGHDFAAPNFLGFVEGKRSIRPKARIGLINVDPHLDVRELENGLPHSGSPFRQILDSRKLQGDRFVEFGIRQNRNARAHFKFCTDHKVKITTLEKLRRTGTVVETFKKTLNQLSKRCDFVAITIDMDCCKDSEGTSAAPVIGFSAEELVSFAGIAGANPKVRYFEVAEISPVLDPTERSSRIGAEIVYSFIASK